MPPPPDEEGGALYEQIASTSSGKLRRSVGAIESLSQEDVDALDRGGKHRLRTHTRRVGVAFMWLGFVCASLLAVAIVGLTGWLLFEFSKEAVAKGLVSPILAGVLQFLFGVAATMAIEGLRKK